MKVKVTALVQDHLGQDTRRTDKNLFKDYVPARFKDFIPGIASSADTRALVPSGPNLFPVYTRAQVRMSDAMW